VSPTDTVGFAAADVLAELVAKPTDQADQAHGDETLHHSSLLCVSGFGFRSFAVAF